MLGLLDEGDTDMMITTRLLMANGACEEDVATFREVFGTSARLTRANLHKADEAGIEVDFLTGLSPRSKASHLIFGDDTEAVSWAAMRTALAKRRREGGVSSRSRWVDSLADVWGLA